jgi:hypothetical protein
MESRLQEHASRLAAAQERRRRRHRRSVWLGAVLFLFADLAGTALITWELHRLIERYHHLRTPQSLSDYLWIATTAPAMVASMFAPISAAVLVLALVCFVWGWARRGAPLTITSAVVLSLYWMFLQQMALAGAV